MASELPEGHHRVIVLSNVGNFNEALVQLLALLCFSMSRNDPQTDACLEMKDSISLNVAERHLQWQGSSRFHKGQGLLHGDFFQGCLTVALVVPYVPIMLYILKIAYPSNDAVPRTGI